jgi:hypothetical protein
MDYKNAIAYTLIVVGFFYNSIGAITLGMLTEINWNILPVLFTRIVDRWLRRG